MKYFTVNEIREKFLSFFESKGSLRLPSFSLIPENDPSILLINAGMTPMKKWFTGAETPPSKRVTTCQKCIRTPDIDRVGLTARHGTYFEMLGNFSFGDYFKKEAITWAWELLTQDLEMDPERLYATVYLDDDEAFDIWKNEVGMPESHISRFGKEDNFWEHGVGPCGPCSEIFFDRGEKYGCGHADCKVGCECDRFIEIWNLVFTQFERLEDGSYVPLEHKNIDTGGGLERFAIVLQDAANFFEVDNIRAILDKTASMANVEYGKDDKTDVALRVITDHIRSTTMMISDGVVPGNEGRGYVLRRLLRRASRYGRLLGIPSPFLPTLAELVIEQNKDAYPDLVERRELILQVILREEESFGLTIQQGLSLLEQDMERARAENRTELAGEDVFRLHDTFGFPVDLTREIAEENGFTIDQAGFDRAMREQKSKGREAQLKKTGSAWDKKNLPESVDRQTQTEFSGYELFEDEAELLHILVDEDGEIKDLPEISAGQEALLIFPRTPFYAESGGQTGDRGLITGSSVKVRVNDTEKSGDGLFLHHVVVEEGTLHSGEKLTLQVDRERRMASARNHTTTHILHKALREVLGNHVEQAGSLVTPDYLRFDFRHFQPMTEDELRLVEEKVNNAILADFPVHTKVMNMEEARQSGAMALFSEKYGDQVRVVSVGDYSSELCGGTHLEHSSQACYFHILSEGGIASGVRRIEAVSGLGAFEESRRIRKTLTDSAALLKTGSDQILEKITSLVEERKKLEKELQAEKSRQSSAQAGDLSSHAEEINGFKVVIAEMQADDPAILREAGDQIRNKLQNVVIVLAAPANDKVLWLAMADKEAVGKGIHCGNLIREAAKMTGGGGGGRPDMAQAGGKDASKIQDAFAKLREMIEAI